METGERTGNTAIAKEACAAGVDSSQEVETKNGTLMKGVVGKPIPAESYEEADVQKFVAKTCGDLKQTNTVADYQTDKNTIHLRRFNGKEQVLASKPVQVHVGANNNHLELEASVGEKAVSGAGVEATPQVHGMKVTNTKTIFLFGQKIEVQVEKEEEKKARPRLAPFFRVNKILTSSDCSLAQGRFMIPNSSELHNLLTTTEQKTLRDSKEGLRVIAIDNQRVQYKLSLSLLPSLNMLVLNKGWNSVIEANMLVEFDKIELRCHRHPDRANLCLCFSLKFYGRAKIHKDRKPVQIPEVAVE